MKKETRQWVRKAEADIRGARKLVDTKPPLNDLTCFHCQQASEKYLKGLLQELAKPVPRTHDLEDLLELLLPHDHTLEALRRLLVALTPFAVDYRYPGESATRREARTALRSAERVRRELRLRLRLKV